MAQINKPSEYFNTVLWTGNSNLDNANQTITGVGFKPDLFWTKIRNAADEHHLRDINLGNTTRIRPNSPAVPNTSVCSVVPNSDGFVITGDDGLEFNQIGNNYVTWNWRGAGSVSSNTDGSITSTVSANTTSGVSIITYTGTGANATIGHGLGVAPSIVLVKNLNDGTQQWSMYNKNLPLTNILILDSTNGAFNPSDNDFQDTAPTANVFYLSGATRTNVSSQNFIAYCFAEKKSFSKFGSYTGNGNADGTFIYTGFKPAFILLKCSSTTGDWQLIDTKRSTFNVCNLRLQANLSDAEAGSDTIDILSNGFKQRNTFGNFNSSGATYIYMAFAEEPLVGTNNVPATAR
jgi:hypothetical protein